MIQGRFKVNSKTVLLSQNLTPICFLYASFVTTQLSQGVLYALVPKGELTKHWYGNSATPQELLKEKEIFKPYAEYVSATSITWEKESNRELS